MRTSDIHPINQSASFLAGGVFNERPCDRPSLFSLFFLNLGQQVCGGAQSNGSPSIKQTFSPKSDREVFRPRVAKVRDHRDAPFAHLMRITGEIKRAQREELVRWGRGGSEQRAERLQLKRGNGRWKSFKKNWNNLCVKFGDLVFV